METDLKFFLWAILFAALIIGAIYWLVLVPRLRELDAARARLPEEREEARRAAIVDAKTEVIAARERAEEELRKHEDALRRLEERLAKRDDDLEHRRAAIEEREAKLAGERESIEVLRHQLLQKDAELTRAIARAAELSIEDARADLRKRLEIESHEAAIKKAKAIEAEVVEAAQERARRVLLDVIQRSTHEYVSEATIAVVELPSEDMKGRIIGREGRNIRAFEQVTGVDLIIDDTPEAVVLSCFDPLRREAARVALMNLMLDGRIHPGRIEESYEKAQIEVARAVQSAGERAAQQAGVSGLPPRVIETLGRLRFRTSYAQNVLDHSVEVAHIAAMIAGELGLNVEVSRRAGLLHDIGKALGPEADGPHALTGMEYLRAAGEDELVLHAVGAHHYDIEPETGEATLVIVADTLSAARPGARRESLENYVKRLTTLEQIANSFAGVERSYALHAGREIRLIVKPDQITDDQASELADAVAARISAQIDLPGQVKVTVIRETRAQSVAR
ncbi:MAG: ribonuclease Y [Fimbriimonadaceae bacterium]